MKYFQTDIFITLMVILPNSFSTTDTGRVQDISSLSQLYQNYIKPFVKNVKIEQSPTFRSLSDIEKAIDDKINSLKKYLQDNDEKGDDDDADNVALDGEDDTVIVEFMPKTNKIHDHKNIDTGNRAIMKPLKLDIKKYEKLRDKIKKSLSKNKLSKKSKLLITKTFDDMLAHMVGNQCMWKSGLDLNKTFNKNLTSSEVLAKAHYFDRSKDYNFDINELRKLQSTLNDFINQFNQIFAGILKNTNILFANNNIKCSILDDKTSKNMSVNSSDVFFKARSKKKKVLRESNEDIEDCKNFVVCSKELKNFMIEIFRSLNDTVINTFNSYGEMYIRDVNKETKNEKQLVLANIYGLGEISERRMKKTYINVVKGFRLDNDKKKRANIANMQNFIATAIAKTKSNLNNIITNHFKNIPQTLRSSLVADITLNIKVDIGNLERELLSRVCPSFTNCNGYYDSRRTGSSSVVGLAANDIYVKVKLNLNENLKSEENNTSSLQLETLEKVITRTVFTTPVTERNVNV